MNETWDIFAGEHIKMPERMKNFIEEIDLVCKKYNLSISHEDEHGRFIIEDYYESNIEWLCAAYKGYKGGE